MRSINIFEAALELLNTAFVRTYSGIYPDIAASKKGAPPEVHRLNYQHWKFFARYTFPGYRYCQRFRALLKVEKKIRETGIRPPTFNVLSNAKNNATAATAPRSEQTMATRNDSAPIGTRFAAPRTIDARGWPGGWEMPKSAAAATNSPPSNQCAYPDAVLT